MRDLSDIPHSKIRSALFWILFGLWPGFRVIEHFWHPPWFDVAETAAASFSSACFLTGYFMFQATQREQSWRLARVEKRITGAESVAPFFDDNGTVRPPLKPGPRLRAVRDDSPGASR